MASSMQAQQNLPKCRIDQESNSSSFPVLKCAQLAFLCEMIVVYCCLLALLRSHHRNRLIVLMTCYIRF